LLACPIANGWDNRQKRPTADNRQKRPTWAFMLPEKFESGISGSLKLGFSKILHKICFEKLIPDISGTKRSSSGLPEIPD